VRKMLMLVDREMISRGLAEPLEYKEIGLRLGRDLSVISREVARHGGRTDYRAAAAQTAACAGRERPKRFAVERSPRLRAVVCQQLREGWSPASIAASTHHSSVRLALRAQDRERVDSSEVRRRDDPAGDRQAAAAHGVVSAAAALPRLPAGPGGGPPVEGRGVPAIRSSREPRLLTCSSAMKRGFGPTSTRARPGRQSGRHRWSRSPANEAAST
jgi:hypothetical protein